MGCFLFIYNIVLIIGFTLYAVLFLLLGIRTKGKWFFCAAAIFIFYFADETLFFAKEVLLLPLGRSFFAGVFIRSSIMALYVLLPIIHYHGNVQISEYGLLLTYILLDFMANVLRISLSSMLYTMFSLCIPLIWMTYVIVTGEIRKERAGTTNIRERIGYIIYAVCNILSPIVTVAHDIPESFGENRSFSGETKSVIFLVLGALVLVKEYNALFSSRAASSQPLPQYGLTARETELLPFFCSGKGSKQIAEECFISVSTVKVHKHNIMTKMGVTTNEEFISAAAKYLEQTHSDGSLNETPHKH